MILECTKISLGVRIQACIQKFGDNLSLGVQGLRAHIHHMIQFCPELILCLAQIGKLRKIDGHDTDGTGGLACAEEAAVASLELAQIQAESAAHGADVGGLHVAVDIVGEIRGSVLRGHLKEQFVVLGLFPVKISGDGVGRDRILEASSLRVALGHDLDKRLVDHVHLCLAVAVGEVLLHAAHNCLLVLQVFRDRPVKRDVGEGRLTSPSGRCVDAVDEALHALLHTLVVQLVCADKRCKVGVEG